MAPPAVTKRRPAVQRASTFDYRQPLVLDTSKIRRELGYFDVTDQREAMLRPLPVRSTEERTVGFGVNVRLRPLHPAVL